MKKTDQSGDVQLRSSGGIDIAIEVKDAILDERGWDRVAKTHGQHSYWLYVLTQGYRPASLQTDISSVSRTLALHLSDFVLSMALAIATEEAVTLASVVNDIVTTYNTEFCDGIEDDTSICINLEMA